MTTIDISGKDTASLLAHMETMQRVINEKDNALKECMQREETVRGQLKQLEDTNEKLSEAKREAMKTDLNERIQGWIRALDSKQVPDALKEEFLAGAEKFVKKGDDTGVWQVMCCASAVHQNQVNTINRLTEEYNALKTKVDGGEFRSDESRKRKEPDATLPATDVWSQLEGMCTSYL